jgi:ankyrin repeat protein
MAEDKNSLAKERLFCLLTELRREPGLRLPETITAAALTGDTESIEQFLAAGDSIEEKSAGFASPLCAAGAAGHLDAVKLLLERGAKPRIEDAPVPPIRACFMAGRTEAALILLKAGAPEFEAAWGLVCAASAGKYSAVKTLLENGVQLDKTYPRVGPLRQKAAEAAEKAGHARLAAFLRGGSAEGLADSPRRSAAAKPGLPPAAAGAARIMRLREALAILRDAGAAAIAWTGKNNESVLGEAAGRGVTEIVKALLEAGADPNGPPGKNTPRPLVRAASAAETEIVKALLEAGADPNAAGPKETGPLQAALEAGRPETVQALLEGGAKPGAKPAGGAKTMTERARGPRKAELLELLGKFASKK